MHRGLKNWGLWLLFSLAIMAGGMLSGCTDDLYASCELEPGSRCAGSSESEMMSCTEEQNLQCETKICARFEGSEPYCTQTCEVDGDCVGGVCREFPFKSGKRHCVESTDA